MDRASEYLRDYDGSVIQMRMAYSAVAHFLIQWADCRLAGKLGLLKVMLYKVSSTVLPSSFGLVACSGRSVQFLASFWCNRCTPLTPRRCRTGSGRPASGSSTVIRATHEFIFRDVFFLQLLEFDSDESVCAGVIFPSLLQLPGGITELDEKKQRRLCLKKFRRAEQLSEVDTERELECGICLEVNHKIVLPDCAHTLCIRCFEDWYGAFLFLACNKIIVF